MQVNDVKIEDGKNARIVEIIDNASDISGSHTANITVGQNAKLRYIFLLHNDIENDFIEKRTITVGDGADVQAYFCYLGGKTVSVNLAYNIQQSARVEHETLFFGKASQDFRFTENYDFQKPSGFGRFHTKGIVSQHAKSNADANIVIRPGAHNTDSRLEMESYILGNEARSNMVPGLQIEANNVRAGHAARVTQINEDQLFYLQSRGLSESQATTLFLEGIFFGFINKLQDEKTEEIILAAVHELHS